MDECDVLPREHVLNDREGVVTVACEDAVCDAAVVVIGAHYLLTVAQFRRVLVRGPEAPARAGMDEQRPAFRIGATRTGRGVGDEQDLLARTGLTQAAPQRAAAFGVRLGTKRLPTSSVLAALIFSSSPDGIGSKMSVLVTTSVVM